MCYTIRVIVAAQDAGLDACANRRGRLTRKIITPKDNTCRFTVAGARAHQVKVLAGDARWLTRYCFRRSRIQSAVAGQRASAEPDGSWGLRLRLLFKLLGLGRDELGKGVAHLRLSADVRGRRSRSRGNLGRRRRRNNHGQAGVVDYTFRQFLVGTDPHYGLVDRGGALPATTICWGAKASSANSSASNIPPTNKK